MDAATVGYVSYRWHRICNPVSFDQLERVLAFANPAAGDRVADLGCGNGVVGTWLAERYRLEVTGVERFAPVAELARAEGARSAAATHFEVREAAAADYLADAPAHRGLVVLGAVRLLPEAPAPPEAMKVLAGALEPGGWLLWGDPFWRAGPTDRLTAAFGEHHYQTLPGWVAAGEAAGLIPAFVSVSADAEWEEFVWRMSASLEDWAVNGPPGDRAEARLRAATVRNLYLEEGRDHMGFGLYLFRKPPDGFG